MVQFHVLGEMFDSSGNFTRYFDTKLHWMLPWADINRNCNTFLSPCPINHKENLYIVGYSARTTLKNMRPCICYLYTLRENAFYINRLISSS